MKCDVCKEAEATVHLTQIVGGAMHKMDLCEPCAKVKGVSDPAVSLVDLMMGLGQSDDPVATAAAKELRCHNCGMTQSDFKRVGRLGCSHCYGTFAEILVPLLRGMHKGEQHVGKRPSRYAENLAAAEQIKLLRCDLEQAVKVENFEAAADLRDRIRKLEEEGHGQSKT